MHEGICQANALTETFGKLADDSAADVREGALFHDAIHALARFFATQTFEPGAKFEVFPHAHIYMQGIILRHVANAATDLDGMVKYIQTTNMHGAGCRG